MNDKYLFTSLSIPLLKAFVEELKEIGYTELEFGTDIFIKDHANSIIIERFDEKNKIYYDCYNHPCTGTKFKSQYNLDVAWAEGLSCAKKLFDTFNQPNYEKGDWLALYNHLKTWIIRLDEIKNDKFVNTLAYNMKKSFIDISKGYLVKNNYFIRRATYEEIKQALIAASKKLGFIEGVEFYSVYPGYNNASTIIPEFPQYDYILTKDQFIINGYTAYYKGAWATPLKNKIQFFNLPVKKINDAFIEVNSCTGLDLLYLKNVKSHLTLLLSHNSDYENITIKELRYEINKILKQFHK